MQLHIIDVSKMNSPKGPKTVPVVITTSSNTIQSICGINVQNTSDNTTTRIANLTASEILQMLPGRDLAIIDYDGLTINGLLRQCLEATPEKAMKILTAVNKITIELETTQMIAIQEQKHKIILKLKNTQVTAVIKGKDCDITIQDFPVTNNKVLLLFLFNMHHPTPEITLNIFFFLAVGPAAIRNTPIPASELENVATAITNDIPVLSAVALGQ